MPATAGGLGRSSRVARKDGPMVARLGVRCSAAAGLATFLLAISSGRQSPALTPESPAVKAAIAKAVTFLESPAANDGRVGARALVGLVLLKSHADPKHPRIVDAVASIQNVVKAGPANANLDIYSAGLAVIFLVTLDANAYRGEVDVLLSYLKTRQKPHGGWGYPDKETGDTSMTQYGVLSAWEATQAGFKPPQESIESVTAWLLKTQDPNGGFGYQGTVPPSSALVKQKEVKHSMVAAGLGSLYICADLLGLTPRADKRNEDLPSALHEVKGPPPAAAANPNAKIDPRRIKEAESRGNHWMGAHHDLHRKEWWTFYYLYAFERYASFRELAEGRPDPEPKWYTDGAFYLLRKQAKDGSWTTDKSPSGITADTAFATLFLLRSSKKSIEKAYGFGDSAMVAGRGLPRDTVSPHVAGGNVRAAPKWTTAAELQPVLEKRGEDFEQGVSDLGQLPPAEAETLATKAAALLRQLAADRSPSTRMAAVRAIGNGANLDLVPRLIYALGDPDNDVALAACEALRRLTKSPGPRAVEGEWTEARRSEEIRFWKDWYLAIRPDAQFEN